MRTPRGKQITFLFIILIGSISCISVSYSGWIDTITIFGDVTTADDFIVLLGHNETGWARMYDNPADFTYSFPDGNWATYLICTPTPEIQTFYLYAGQTHRVGELYVWKDDGSLYIKYDLDPGFLMEETHVHVATSLDDIPQASGNPVPGDFDYQRTYDPYQPDDTYQIDWNVEWNEEDLYIAAHAVVWGYF